MAISEGMDLELGGLLPQWLPVAAIYEAQLTLLRSYLELSLVDGYVRAKC